METASPGHKNLFTVGHASFSGDAQAGRSENLSMPIQLFAILCLLAEPALADTLTWEKSVEEASRGNSELNASKSSLQAADYQSTAAYANFWPQVSGTLEYNRSSALASVSNGFITNAKNAYSVTLNASENLFNGFQDKAKVAQADANAGVALATLNTTRAKVSFDLKSAFAGLVYAQNNIKLSEDIVKRREANLHLVQLRFESGRENSSSVLLSKAYLEDAKYALLQARNQLDTARAQLARVLGRDDDASFEITGNVPTKNPPDGANLRNLALETPSYRQSLAQEESADAGIVIARSGFFPTLNVTGLTGKTGPEWYPDSSRWSVGASLTLPIFNGGKDLYGTKAATQTWKAASSTRANTLRLSFQTLKSNHSAFVEAVQKLEVDRTYQDASIARERIAKQKYNNGLLTFDDWDIIENDLISRQKAFIQSERDRVLAEAAWEQALGKGAIP